jgi:hypothetical protein
MPTHPSWRVAVANLRNLTAGVTPKQRKLAARVGLQLPKSLPRLVAAARLKVAYSAELCTEPVQPATDSQLDYLSDLSKERGGDAEVHASRIEASAWIEFYLMKRRREALEKLRLEAGDIVQIEDSGGVRHEEVASLGITLKNDNLLEEHARKGVSQVNEWREWILNKLALARLARGEGGLGLLDIRPDSEGLALLGRRARLGENAKEVRAGFAEKDRIKIHTYDHLLERLGGQLRFRGPSGSSPNLIQHWRDGNDDQNTHFDELLGGMETDEPVLDGERPFITGKK